MLTTIALLAQLLTPSNTVASHTSAATAVIVAGIQIGTDSEDIETVLDRKFLARARCSSGLIETGDLENATKSWKVADMPWTMADSGPFANE
jgi:hypothetical protein